jgi:hypothetical protein
MNDGIQKTKNQISEHQYKKYINKLHIKKRRFILIFFKNARGNFINKMFHQMRTGK